MTIALQP